MLLLAAVLALFPASGLALCVADSGHVALELAGTSCGQVGDATCMTASDDCKDTPLSVGSAQRTPTQAVTAPTLLPAAPVLAITLETPVAAAALPTNLASRSPLLRC